MRISVITLSPQDGTSDATNYRQLPFSEKKSLSYQPLDRILQSQGFGTRNWCRAIISEGQVRINNVVIVDYRLKFNTVDLEFTVYDEASRFREHLYIALNKPANYECSRKSSHHPGVLSLLPEQFSRRNLQPVGRLDHDTTGLLLLSDDGAFIHTQSSPKRHIKKLYVATTREVASPQLVEQLLSGVLLNDEPAQLKALVCRLIDTHQIEIVLEQGKYHQVKRMLAAAGNHCAALRRTRIGGLTLDALDLNEGAWCYLESEQLALLHG